jgi:glycosyltransferase involved in cell wall biosynthesis
MRVVVTIPAYNEALNIASVIRDIPRTIHENNEVLILVVDDGSEDQTARMARNAGADFVLRHRRNMGVAKAFKTAVRSALTSNPDVIVNIDADGQFNPNEIPKLVSPILLGQADLVLGSRFVEQNYGNMPVIKQIGNRIISLIVSYVLGTRIHDTQCGFRAFTKEAAQKMRITGLFTYTQEAILDLAFRGLRIREIPICVKYFQKRKSRVVTSVPTYTLKVLGNIAISIARHQYKRFLMVLLLTTIALVLIAAFVY